MSGVALLICCCRSHSLHEKACSPNGLLSKKLLTCLTPSGRDVPACGSGCDMRRHDARSRNKNILNIGHPHAQPNLRESVGARAREMEEDISTAPPSPGSQDHVSRAQALVDVQQRGHLNERPPVPDSRRTPSSSTSREHVPIDAVAQRLQSPLVHPRQVTRTENAYRAVFEALMRLLPPPIVGTGGGSNDGRDVARMQAAAVRCGSQCQGYIHSLQQGVQVGDRRRKNGNGVLSRV